MYGNSPRNPLVGPGINTWDLSASKSFKMPRLESHSLLFRAEFFNAFNTPQFSDPDYEQDSATFGQILSTAVSPRIIQFALKLNF